MRVGGQDRGRSQVQFLVHKTGALGTMTKGVRNVLIGVDHGMDVVVPDDLVGGDLLAADVAVGNIVGAFEGLLSGILVVVVGVDGT